jgi:hypothetical protein
MAKRQSVRGILSILTVILVSLLLGGSTTGDGLVSTAQAQGVDPCTRSQGGNPPALSPAEIADILYPVVKSTTTPPANVDCQLWPAWNALSTQTLPDGNTMPGDGHRRALENTGVSVRVGPLPSGTNGIFARDSNSIIIGQHLLRESSIVVATVLAHELAHASEFNSGAYNWDTQCVDMEAVAFLYQAFTWRVFAYKLGSWPMATALERENTELAKLYEAEGVSPFYEMIRTHPYYRSQCHIL